MLVFFIKAIPTEPKNLTVYHLDQESIKLKWNSIGNYSLNTIQYIISCFKCINNSESRNSICVNKVTCENYTKYIPDRNRIFKNEFVFFNYSIIYNIIKYSFVIIE